MKQGVLKHTPVSSRQNKPVPVEPVRVLGVIPNDLVVQYMTHRGTAHGQARVTRIGLLDGVDGQEPDGVDGFVDEGGVGGLVEGLNGGGGPDGAAARGQAGGGACGEVEGGCCGVGGGFEGGVGGEGERWEWVGGMGCGAE